MAFLRIERVPIGVANLGLFGFDHLQLVLQDTVYDPTLTQDNWRVVEGVVDLGQLVGVEGADGTTTLSLANQGKTGDDLIAAIGTPSSRGSRILVTDNPLGAWTAITTAATAIDGQRLPYIAIGLPGSAAPAINSTSVIASLLYYAGFDISQSWPSGTMFSPGWTTLIGTLGDDNLALTQSFSSLLGGVGDDTLTGSRDDRIDRLLGGVGNDTLRWTEGLNYLHGGQTRLDYALDGIDTVDYTGAGTVTITGHPHFIENKTPTFTAVHAGGRDYLYSIERIEWATGSDHIIVNDGAGLLPDGLEMKLGGQASSGHGDTLDFSQQSEGILANASATGDALLIKDLASAADEAGLWAESAEWLIGSAGDDQIWAATGLRGVEGGEGSDLIDARAVAAFSGASPAGYDIEIDGGGGNDTLVADAGRTLLHGGSGADRFVLSAMTGGAGTVEIVIDDADAADRLLVPYDLFNGSEGMFDGSPLMTLLGGIGPYADMEAGGLSVFDWRTQPQMWFGSDPALGQFRFQGEIEYSLDAGDLLVHLYLGETLDYGPDKVMVFHPETETIVRVKDFQVGMLGLSFFDYGSQEIIDVPGLGPTFSFSNWDAAVTALTTDVFSAPVQERPEPATTSPLAAAATRDAAPPVLGGDGDDTITLASIARVQAGAGNDTIVGSAAADIIDGGSGADSMAGGGGNDRYAVDDAGDAVVETAGGGRDQVSASVSYVLADWVEDLVLTGGATTGTGNGLANRLVGNDAGNVLSGGDGDDTLAGDLGDDMLIGGAGRDVYVYGLGDGRDTVIDGAAADETSTLVLTGGISADTITMLRLQTASNDLVLRFADGGQLTITGYYAPANAGAVDVAFEDGSGWSAAEFASRASAATLVAELPPVAIDDPYLLSARGTIVVPAASLLANDLSPDGGPLTIVAVNATGGGTATLRGDGDIEVTAGASGGPTTFSYTISDGTGTASADVTVAFELNHAPVAGVPPPDATATPGSTFSLALPASLFTDADLDPLNVSARLADGSALPGWLTFDRATWTFTGTPPAASGGSTFDVVLTASDGLDQTSTALRIAVSGGVTNVAPTAVDDALQTEQGVAIAFNAATLLGNDSDPDGDTLTVQTLTAPAHGSLVATADGGWRYTPDATFSGTDAISYVVADGQGHTASANLSITVTPSIPGAVLSGDNKANLLIGTERGDTLTGAGGDDTITGLGGNDVFLFAGTSNGVDVIDGGAGFDLLLGSSGDDLITLADGTLTGIEAIDGGGGNDTLRGSIGNDLIDLSAVQVSGLELIDGGAGIDTIIGSAGNDTISGGSAQSFLYGGAGDDTLLVTSGVASVYVGGAGYDRLLGTSGNDLIAIAAVAGNLSGVELIDGGAGNDTLRGTSGDDLIDLSQLLVEGIELIDAAGGNDTVIGSSGNDTISGGGGQSTIFGGGGDDTLLVASASASLYDGGAGYDRLLGTAADDLITLLNVPGNLSGIELIDGGGGNDILRGTAADDAIDLTSVTLVGIARVQGGGGNDTLTGSRGDDTLSGGSGNDVYRLAIDGGHDVIADFQRTVDGMPLADVIDVSAWGLTSLAEVLAITTVDASGNAVLHHDPATSVTLTGIAPGQLAANDFRFA